MPSRHKLKYQVVVQVSSKFSIHAHTQNYDGVIITILSVKNHSMETHSTVCALDPP